jgi:hypothetical protein
MRVVDYLVARTAPPARSGLAYDYVLAGKGLFVAADNDYLRVTIPIASCAVRGLPALYAECSLLHGRLPAVLWDTILQTARPLDSIGQEVLLTARFDLEHGYWLVLPSQVVEPASVRYAPADGVVLEVHSHRTGPARFSATDTADEQRLRVYGVVGRLDRNIFAERFDGALARYARRTDATTDLLTTFALQAGGEGGARLARTAGVPVSPDTLLRLLRAMQDQAVPTPRVLGVDDLALRRGKRRYGTILINLETHRPVDLIDERTAGVFADWLRRHPGVEIIVRDRAGAYAEGGRQGAPDAIQVADRFHLSANASAALDEVLRSRRRLVEYVVVAAEPNAEGVVLPAIPPTPISRAKQYNLEVRARRTARWEAVRERFAAGQAQRQIARELGIARMTVQRLLTTPRPSTADLPESCPPEPSRPGGLSSPSLLPYLVYLQTRWQAGCSNILQLHREIAELGYTGSRSLMYRALVPWRGPRPPPEPGRRVGGAGGRGESNGSACGGSASGHPKNSTVRNTRLCKQHSRRTSSWLSGIVCSNASVD